MKRILLVLLVFNCLALSAQKKNKNILKSTNIKEIENFLKTAHPEDPRRIVLKPKLVALKNSEWTKGKKTAKPMAARPIVVEVPNNVVKHPNSAEAQEFNQLIAESSDAHKAKTVKLLNTLFDEDVKKKEVILLIQNNSDCNLILRIQGKNYYNLAVSAHGENSIVLDKGDYQLTSNLCDVKYASSKKLTKSTVVILNNPVVKIKKGKLANATSSSTNNKMSP